MDKHAQKGIDLQIAAQRRLPRPVLAATRVRMDGCKPSRCVLAITDDHVLWWIALRRLWGVDLGQTIGWLHLDHPNVAVYTAEIPGNRWKIEISQPACGLLHTGELYGPGAANLVGHISARELAVS